MASRRWTIPAAAVALALAVAPRVASFSMDPGVFVDPGALAGVDLVHLGEPVHEEITEAALRHVTDEISPRLVRHIVRGNQNADGPTHKFDDVYHVNNANTTNGMFTTSFRTMRSLVDAAVAGARDNDEFWRPRHDTLHGIVDDVAETLRDLGLNYACNGLGESACPQVELLAKAVEIAGHGLRLLANPMADPHGLERTTLANLRADLRALLDTPGDRRYCRPLTSHCFERLDAMLRDNEYFQADVRRLRRLERELRAYVAWQNLGHAFHIAQDFFAHSNFVELINGRAGPPCGSLHDPAICGRALAERVDRDDPVIAPFLARLRPTFALNLETLEAVLGTRFRRLQTGVVRLSPGLGKEGVFCVDTLPPGFDYCHWPHKHVPGLNKDDAGDPEREPAHANHAHARRVAQYASEALWEDFLRRAEFLPPATSAKKEALKRAKLAHQRAIEAALELLADDD